jgi:hypothetical protein
LSGKIKIQIGLLLFDVVGKPFGESLAMAPPKSPGRLQSPENQSETMMLAGSDLTPLHA